MDKPSITVEGIELNIGKLYRTTRSIRVFSDIEISPHGRVKAANLTNVSGDITFILLDYHDNDKLFVKDKFGVNVYEKNYVIDIADDDFKLSIMVGKHVMYVCFLSEEIPQYIERIM